MKEGAGFPSGGSGGSRDHVGGGYAGTPIPPTPRGGERTVRWACRAKQVGYFESWCELFLDPGPRPRCQLPGITRVIARGGYGGGRWRCGASVARKEKIGITAGVGCRIQLESQGENRYCVLQGTGAAPAQASGPSQLPSHTLGAGHPTRIHALAAGQHCQGQDRHTRPWLGNEFRSTSEYMGHNRARRHRGRRGRAVGASLAPA